MAFNVYWDDKPRTILRWDQIGTTTVATFRTAVKKTNQLIAEIDHQFDLLIVGSGDMPRFPISELQNAFRNASPKQNLTVFVTNDLLSRALVGVLQKMGLPITKRIAFADDVDNARDLIRIRRQHIA